jgi:hypothetical protein
MFEWKYNTGSGYHSDNHDLYLNNIKVGYVCVLTSRAYMALPIPGFSTIVWNGDSPKVSIHGFLDMTMPTIEEAKEQLKKSVIDWIMKAYVGIREELVGLQKTGVIGRFGIYQDLTVAEHVEGKQNEIPRGL